MQCLINARISWTSHEWMKSLYVDKITFASWKKHHKTHLIVAACVFCKKKERKKKDHKPATVDFQRSVKRRWSSPWLASEQSIWNSIDAFATSSVYVRSVHVCCSVSSPAARGDSLISGSPTPGARGLQSFLVSPLVVSLDVAVASQDAVPGLQFTTQQVQEFRGEVASSVVDLTHYDISGPLGRKRANVEVTEGGKSAKSNNFCVCTKHVLLISGKRNSHIPQSDALVLSCHMVFNLWVSRVAFV